MVAHCKKKTRNFVKILDSELKINYDIVVESFTGSVHDVTYTTTTQCEGEAENHLDQGSLFFPLDQRSMPIPNDLTFPKIADNGAININYNLASFCTVELTIGNGIERKTQIERINLIKGWEEMNFSFFSGFGNSYVEGVIQGNGISKNFSTRETYYPDHFSLDGTNTMILNAGQYTLFFNTIQSGYQYQQMYSFRPGLKCNITIEPGKRPYLSLMVFLNGSTGAVNYDFKPNNCFY